jgi:hypothetical protein
VSKQKLLTSHAGGVDDGVGVTVGVVVGVVVLVGVGDGVGGIIQKSQLIKSGSPKLGPPGPENSTNW